MRKRKTFLLYLFFVFILLIIISLGNTKNLLARERRTSAQKQFDRNIKTRHLPKGSVAHRQFNFHVVEPGLWRSSQPNDASLLLMKKYGLKTIVNLRRNQELVTWEKIQAQKLNIKYYSFPMNPMEPQDNDKLQKIVNILANPSNRPVLVHCQAGKDRTGLIIALYKVRYTNETFNDIYLEMIMYGFLNDKYHEITKTVKSWYMTYRK